jgi:hypothetical protein
MIFSGFAASSEAEQGLECGGRLLATVVPEDKFIQINLKLCPAHSMVSADQPLLEVAKNPISKWDSDFAPLRNSDRSGWVRGATCLN